MIEFTDDEIDLFAQTLHAGYFADMGESSVLWEHASGVQKGNWRRAARALVRHLYHGQPVNKAPHHMSEEETEVIRLCDEYETVRVQVGRIPEASANLIANTLAEHFALIRRAVHEAKRVGVGAPQRARRSGSPLGEEPRVTIDPG